MAKTSVNLFSGIASPLSIRQLGGTCSCVRGSESRDIIEEGTQIHRRVLDWMDAQKQVFPYLRRVYSVQHCQDRRDLQEHHLARYNEDPRETSKVHVRSKGPTETSQSTKREAEDALDELPRQAYLGSAEELDTEWGKKLKSLQNQPSAGHHCCMMQQ